MDTVRYLRDGSIAFKFTQVDLQEGEELKIQHTKGHLSHVEVYDKFNSLITPAQVVSTLNCIYIKMTGIVLPDKIYKVIASE